MTQKGFRISLGMLISTTLLLVGCTLLFLQLGMSPLSNKEAEVALGVSSLIGESESATWPVVPAYAAPTAVLFSMFGSSGGLARVLPALSGLTLLLLPLLKRKDLGWSRVVLIQAGMLLSPVHFSTMRIAGGSALALMSWAGILLLSTMEERKTWHRRTIAVLLGVLVCSGPAFFQSIITMFFSMIFLILLGENDALARATGWIRAILPELGWSLATIFLLSSQFGTAISSVQNMFSGLEVWLEGWREGQIGLLTAFTLLPLYEPLLLLAGVAGALFTFRNKPALMDRAAILAVAGGFFAFILYPGRQLTDLIWVVAPLLWLASKGLTAWMARMDFQEEFIEQIVLSAAMLSLLTFAYFQFQGYRSGRGIFFDPGFSTEQLVRTMGSIAVSAIAAVMLYLRKARRRSWMETGIVVAVLLSVAVIVMIQLVAMTQSGDPILSVDMGLQLRFWAGVGALLLIIVVFVLTGLGWSWSLAEKVAGTTFLVVVLMMSLSNLVRLNFPTESAPLAEPIRPEAVTEGMVLLDDTLRDVAVRASGRDDRLEVVLFGEVPPSLHWILRRYSPEGGEISMVPQAILFPADMAQPALSGQYRGQTLTILLRLEGLEPGTSPFTPVFSTQTARENWVLLVREDLSTLQPLLSQPAQEAEQERP